MSFIVRNRRKGWKRTIPDKSMVHPDIDCNTANIKHIYNNWVQPIQPPEKKYERLCIKPQNKVIGMPSSKSALLRSIINHSDSNYFYNQCHDFGNLYTTAKSTSTSSVCCDEQKLFIVKDLTKSYEDYIFKKRETENYNSNTGCCKPFPYDINQRRRDVYSGLPNVEQAYLDYNYYGIISVWDICLNLNEDLYTEYEGKLGIEQNVDFTVTFPNLTLSKVNSQVWRVTSPSGDILDVFLYDLNNGNIVLDTDLYSYWGNWLTTNASALDFSISPAHTSSLAYNVQVRVPSIAKANVIKNQINTNNTIDISSEYFGDISMSCGTPTFTYSPLEINLPYNDDELYKGIKYTLIEGPYHGIIDNACSIGKKIYYTPSADYVGLDFFCVTLTTMSGMVAGPATIFLDISSINDSPILVNPVDITTNLTLMNNDNKKYIAVSETYNNIEYPRDISLVATDVDTANTASFEFIIDTLPVRGKLTDDDVDIAYLGVEGYKIKNYKHYITYTPYESSIGVDSFTYHVIDNDPDTRIDAETGKSFNISVSGEINISIVRRPIIKTISGGVHLFDNITATEGQYFSKTIDLSENVYRGYTWDISFTNENNDEVDLCLNFGGGLLRKTTNSTNVEIIGYPHWDASGIYTVNLKVVDEGGEGRDDASFSLTVFNTDPLIETTTIPFNMSRNEGVDISHVIELSLITTGISSDYAWNVVMEDENGTTIPNDGSWNSDLSINRLDVSSARINGEPGWDMSGVYTIIVDVNDGHGGYATSSFELIIRHVNPTFIILNAPQDMNEGYDISFSVSIVETTISSEISAYDWDISSSPTLSCFAGYDLSINYNGIVSGNPYWDSSGSYTITISVDDNVGGANDVSFVLTVNGGGSHRSTLLNGNFELGEINVSSNNVSSEQYIIITASGDNMDANWPEYWKPYNNNNSEYAQGTCIDVSNNTLKLHQRNNVYAYQTMFLEKDTDYMLSFDACYYGSDISDSHGLYIFMLGAEDLVYNFAYNNHQEIKEFFDNSYVFTNDGLYLTDGAMLIEDFSAVLYKNISIGEIALDINTHYDIAFNTGDKENFLLIIGKHDQMVVGDGESGFKIDNVEIGIGDITFHLLHKGLQHEVIFNNVISGMNGGIAIQLSDNNMLSNDGIIFNGNEYVDIGDSGGSVTMGGEMTFALWACWNEMSVEISPAVLFDFTDFVDENGSYDSYSIDRIRMMSSDSSGSYYNVVFNVDVGITENATISSDTIIEKDKWTHIVATVKQNKLTLYVDSVHEYIYTNEVTIEPTLKRRVSHRIGNSEYSGSGFKGMMKSLQIWNHALDNSEVVNLYNESSAYYEQPSHELLFYKNNLSDNIGEMNISLVDGTSYSFGEGIVFDGSNDYMDMSSVLLGGPMTIALWARFEVSMDDLSINGPGYWERLCDFSENIVIGRNSYFTNLFFMIKQDTGEYEVSGGVISPNVWTHVVCTVSGSLMMIYQDGLEVVSDNNGLEPMEITRTNHLIGKSNTSGDTNFEGAISSLHIWNRALSVYEVKALYNRGRLFESFPLINTITKGITVNPSEEINIYTSLTNPNYLINNINFYISSSPPLSCRVNNLLTIDSNGYISGTPDWYSAGNYVITVRGIDNNDNTNTTVNSINLVVQEAYGLINSNFAEHHLVSNLTYSNNRSNLIHELAFHNNDVSDNIGIMHGTLISTSYSLGEGIVIDGSNSYMQLDSVELGGPMTIALWARWDMSGNWSRLIDFGNDDNSYNIIIGQNSNTNEIYGSIRDSGNGTDLSGGEIVEGEWTHVAMTVTISGDVTLFQDGIAIDSITNGNVPDIMTRTNHYIGKSNTSGVDTDFECVIASLHIWDNALSETEVNALYNRGIGTMSRSGLVNSLTNNHMTMVQDKYEFFDGSGGGYSWAGEVGMSVNTNYEIIYDSSGAKFNDASYSYIQLNEGELGGPMTIAIWAKWDDFGEYSSLCHFCDESTNEIYIGLNEGVVTSSTHLYDCIFSIKERNDDGTPKEQEVFITSIVSNTWTHIVCTVEKNVMKIYHDGSLVDARYDVEEPLLTTRTYHYLGRYHSGVSLMTSADADKYFSGYINSMYIWRYALTDNEVKYIYNNGNDVPLSSDYMPIPNAMIDYNRFVNYEFLFHKNNNGINKNINIGEGIVFNPTETDVVTITELVGTTIGGEMTIALWVKWYDLSDTSDCIISLSKDDSGSGTHDIIEIVRTGSNELIFKIDNENEYIASAVNMVNVNEWTHVVATVGENESGYSRMCLYKDGGLETDLEFIVEPRVVSRDLTYLGRRETNSENMSGAISSLHIWNHVLNRSEITELFNHGRFGSPLSGDAWVSNDHHPFNNPQYNLFTTTDECPQDWKVYLDRRDEEPSVKITIDDSSIIDFGSSSNIYLYQDIRLKPNTRYLLSYYAAKMGGAEVFGSTKLSQSQTNGLYVWLGPQNGNSGKSIISGHISNELYFVGIGDDEWHNQPYREAFVTYDYEEYRLIFYKQDKGIDSDNNTTLMLKDINLHEIRDETPVDGTVKPTFKIVTNDPSNGNIT